MPECTPGRRMTSFSECSFLPFKKAWEIAPADLPAGRLNAIHLAFTISRGRGHVCFWEETVGILEPRAEQVRRPRG